MPTRCDVLVIGAGPAGSSTAAALAAGGMRVTLVEAAVHPRPKACAEYASPRIVEELSHVGLAPAAWRAAALPLDGMRLLVAGSTTDIRYADRRGSRTAWGLDRLRFDARLAEHAASVGAVLRVETRLEELVVDNGRVAGAWVRRRDGRRETISAGWVVGADGARSRTARLLGVERRVRLPSRLGLVAHYSGVSELSASGEMHVGDGLYVGLAPTPGNELNVGMALPLGGRGGSLARFEATLAGMPAVAARLAGSRRLTPIRGAAPIGQRVAETAGPGWLLVGDAAGFIDPFTGEGIYRALRSARAAATALTAQAGANDELGAVAAAYRAARRRAFASKDALTWMIQAMLAAPPLLHYAVQRLAARPEAALRLGSALGDCRPSSTALSPRAIIEVLAP
jgi:menaquinone-9 beta-reductase